MICCDDVRFQASSLASMNSQVLKLQKQEDDTIGCLENISKHAQIETLDVLYLYLLLPDTAS